MASDLVLAGDERGIEIHGQCIDSRERINTLYPKWIYPPWIEAMAKKAPEEAPDPRTMLPLTPAVFHIMLALAGGECHGYAIMQEVERLTGGLLNLGPGTLYRSIQRMLIDGLIEETKLLHDSDLDDERRRYYRITPFGLEVARAEAERLELLVDAARQRKLLPEKKGKRS
jgi:DNA-binding PadR family transcriptional regulator